MTKNTIIEDSLVQLARISLSKPFAELRPAIRQISKRIQKIDGRLAADLGSLLESTATESTRDASFGSLIPTTEPDPSLIKVETDFSEFKEPILSPLLARKFELILAEQAALHKLARAKIEPTRSLLFVGPPGVGKTMTAHWLAMRLNRPLITLNLASVMSSYLGQTGSNVKSVLDHAKSQQCVLLLDELDAIAKRRDDSSDVGELKRLVTVLLQEIDEWPSSSLLVAATNHGELLDPAIWRRFDDVMHFDAPAEVQVKALILSFLNEDEALNSALMDALLSLWTGTSMSDIRRDILWARRISIVTDEGFEQNLLERAAGIQSIKDTAERKKIAKKLIEAGMSERKVSALIGISRDTLRKERSFENELEK